MYATSSNVDTNLGIGQDLPVLSSFDAGHGRSAPDKTKTPLQLSNPNKHPLASSELCSKTDYQ